MKLIISILISAQLCVLCQANELDWERKAGKQGDAGLSGLVTSIKEAVAVDTPPPAPAPAPGQSNELIQFWEKLRTGVFDGACKNARLELNRTAVLPNAGGITGRFRRYLLSFPDNRIALIDEAGVEITGALASSALNLAGRPVGLSINGVMSGNSIVVRKLAGTRFCGELGSLADLREVKTILPVTTDRITGMGSGEIWKMPVVLRVGINAGAGLPFPSFSIGFSMGAAKEAKPSITLFKMDENRLRLRIRLDRATITSAGLSVSAAVIPAGSIGLPEGESALARFADQALAHELNKYVAFGFGFSKSRAGGKKILLEFSLDAKDRGQTERLVEFLRGDMTVLRKLIEMGVVLTDYSDTDSAGQGAAELDGMEDIAGQTLGLAAAFSGSNHYNANTTAASLTVPVLYSGSTANTSRYDRYQSRNGREVLHVQSETRTAVKSGINIPLAGTMYRYTATQTMHAVNYEDKTTASVGDTALVYQRYEGIAGGNEHGVKRMVDGVNDILQYAGRKGGGTTSAYALDSASLFPKVGEAEAAFAAGADETQLFPNYRGYRSAVMSTNIVFSRKGVREILSSSAEVIAGAVLNIADSQAKKIMAVAAGLFSVGEDGKVSYDWRKVKTALDRAFLGNEGEQMQVFQEVCGTVEKVTQALFSARDSGDWKTRSGRLSKALSGEDTGLGYESMLKVVIQLVDPADIYANLTLHTDKGIKGEANLSETRQAFSRDVGQAYQSQFQDASDLRSRFADPSALTD